MNELQQMEIEYAKYLSDKYSIPYIEIKDGNLYSTNGNYLTMKILLDTNIIIHREANKIYKLEIGQLFKWIDNLKYSKYIHPLTIEELERYKDPNALDTMSIKIESYNLLKNQAPLGEEILKVSGKIDNQDNDINDTQILNEVYENRVDILISEDKKIHTKAKLT